MYNDLMADLKHLVERSVVKETAVGGDTRYVFADAFIAGFRYSDGPDILPYLHPGEKLDLIAEPGNFHDEWAVRIEHRKSRIGYVPRSINRAVSQLLSDGAKIDAEIVTVNTEAAPWECVQIRFAVLLMS